MAIKGKRKGKARSGRTVTAGPRPVYVQPKTPLFQRTGMKVVLVLFLEALVFAILVGFDAQSDTERHQEAVTEFSQLVDAAMAQEGAVQSLPGGALVLPELGQTIPTLGTEDAVPEEIVEKAEVWSTQASGAADRVGQVELPEEGSLEPEQRGRLASAREEMERGLLMYSTLADEVGIAAQIDGDLQDQAIASVQEFFLLAGSTFDAGYSQLQEVRDEVGLLPSTATPPGGLPGGLPGGIPGLPGGGVPSP
jgi:hypothetical protein